MEAADLKSWLGKPLERQTSQTKSPNDLHSGTSVSEHDSGSNCGRDNSSIGSQETASSSPVRSAFTSSQGSEEDGDIPYQALAKPSSTSRGFYVDIPKLAQHAQESYKFLPGHFSVNRIISEFRGERYLIKLHSGETDLVTSKHLRKLVNGEELLADYTRKAMASWGTRSAGKPATPEMVDWTRISLSGSDDSSSVKDSRRNTRKRKKETHYQIDAEQGSDSSSSGKGSESEFSEAGGRRSLRRNVKKPNAYYQDGLLQLSDDSGETPRRRGRAPRLRLHQSAGNSTRTQRSIRPNVATSTRESVGARRSERTRTQPRRDMRERQEDEISAHSEEEAGPRVVGTKEIFTRLPESHPFRRRHRPECDTCTYRGDLEDKGPLVFCQGCTNSHHKACLGPRGSRDHLVTKIGEKQFILQCRRCLGRAQAKDMTAPHQGVCSACNELGALSKPLRERLTTRQEQLQREENGGHDPTTIVEPEIADNIANVMFRCATCQRGWHMHHMPKRETTQSQHDEHEDEELTETELAQRRFDFYHHSWICKDCVENQNLIDTLVAWRPVDLEKYTPGFTVEMMKESEKEYLVKWKAQSYFRTTWMPGSWVWGISAGSMRTAFMKKEGKRLPKMTTKDAIPEDFFRIDIVFDVRYSSVVRNSTKEIDIARVKEVDSAYVKYKGLGYEDAIWETPPRFDDTERWEDFRIAYEDYVLKKHVSIPPQRTLSRHLAAVRSQDFETVLLKRTQPSSLTGGGIMEYQLEGLNWLLYQWYDNKNAILADEMGLGKTIQLIALFATLVQDHKCWPFLVVVPNSTCPNWRREVKKWAPSLRVVTYYGSAQAKKLTADFELFPKDPNDEDRKDRKGKRPEAKDIKAHVVVTSYEAISDDKTRASLMRVPWQGLVVDEGQRLKNDKNLVYEALSKFNFRFKVLLTGTPLQNNTRELFNLLQFLDKKFDAAALEIEYEHLTEENVPKLHELIRPYFLRRTKAQVLTFLPPMAQIILPVTMSAVQKKVYKSILAKNPELMKSIFSRDGPAAGKERHSLNNILMQLRKALCHPFVYSREIEERGLAAIQTHRNLVEASSKLQLLQIMLPKLRERGHRVLIFSQFLDNLDIVEDFLDGLALQHRRLDGSINSMEKQKRIDDFNSPDSPFFAFLLSTRAGGVGINLATADTVIIMDPDFNPHQDIQALSRAHRIGQRQKVLVFQLMTRGSAEEKIMQIGKKKMALDHILIQQMDQEDEAGMNLESILRHGAEALFDDDGTNDIVYDSASVEKLLDRSQIESTSAGEDKSAASQFSFARIWTNDKAALEDGLQDSGTTTPGSSAGIWDKILKEREAAFAEEAARKAEALGRGKRKRHAVDYGPQDGAEPDLISSPFKRADPDASDTDFQAREMETDEDVTQAEDADVSLSDLPREPKRPTVKARPFKRIKVPMGPAPLFGGDGPADFRSYNELPPTHLCSACDEVHPMGWCRLKIAGVEHCGLCGLAHVGHGRTCPHLNSEVQVATLLATLKESTEPKELTDEAVKYLRMIRGDLVQRKRNQARKQQEAAARAQTGATSNGIRQPDGGRPNSMMPNGEGGYVADTPMTNGV